MSLTASLYDVAGPMAGVRPLRPGTAAVPAAIRVLLVHPEGLVRAALRALLERERDVAVIGEAADGPDAVAAAAELKPDVVLMDARLPRGDVHEATRRMVAERRGVAVLVLGSGDTDEELFGALRAGARGFLVREADPVELLRGIRSVSQGHALVSPSLTLRLIEELASQPGPHRPAPEELAELTAREREVMGLVAMGLTNGEIADRLVISRATAKTHVSRAMVKLHARDRAQLVTLAYQTHLVEPRPASTPCVVLKEASPRPMTPAASALMIRS